MSSEYCRVMEGNSGVYERADLRETMEGTDVSLSASSSAAEEGTSTKFKPWQSYHTVYTNAKAGMEGVDKEKVQKVVYEMSKSSKHFENEQKKDLITRMKTENLRARCCTLSEADLLHYQKVAEKRIAELEATRDLSKIWLHVDMDAFYAAVETLSNPSLNGKPMAVGSMSMISTANYEARKFGVRAAMPGFIGLRLCPELVFVAPDFKKYNYYSEKTRKVFQDYDPHFVAASLDEAYLDITEICKRNGYSGEKIAEELRSRVFEETGLTCSAGVAPNRLLAKVCSDINKPNGQFSLPNDRSAVTTFISSLPIRKISGIGKVTEQILKDGLGINTCEDLLKNSGYLCALFPRCSSDFFFSVGLGLGGTDKPEIRSRKSISNERTFSATNDVTLFNEQLAEISQMLCADMEKERLRGRTLTLKLKTASFEVRTRTLTLQKYIFSSEDILRYASQLLKAELPISLRLIGLRMSCFMDNDKILPSDPTQKTLGNYVMPLDDQLVRNTCHSHSSEDYNESNSGQSQLAENGSHLININKKHQTMDDIEPVISWIDGYVCSSCGIEIPHEFTEERVEHSDFHIADMLQKQEPSSSRFCHKDKKSKIMTRKKAKPSPKEDHHVRIDAFFVKNNKQQ